MRNFCVCKIVATFILVAILVGCGHIETAQIVSPKVDGIQSITFVSEQSEDGNALSYYSEEYDGTIVPGEMTLNFSVLPSEFADILASEWKTSLSVKIKYSKPQSSIDGEYGDLSILGVSSPSEGILTVRASCENIDKSFFKKELSASVRLMAVFDGVKCLSGFIPVIPYLIVDDAEKIYIPDTNLKSLLREYDSNRDGEISVKEAEAITGVLCEDCEISDLTGLESCPNLTIINCSGNNISTINIHNLPKLTELYCDNNNISDISLHDLPQLTTLKCSYNKISTISLQDLPKLAELYCDNNNISDISLLDLPQLTTLKCSYNKISAISLQDRPQLTSIDCSHCKLTTIDLHNLTNLNTLDCVGNPVKKFVLDNCDALEWLLFNSIRDSNSIDDRTRISFDGYSGVDTFEFRMSSSRFTSFSFKDSFVRSLVIDGDFVSVAIVSNSRLESLVSLR